MTRAVVITQLIDPNDPVLGIVPGLVRALAERAGGATVIANEVRSSVIGEGIQVISLGKERGASRAARTLALQRAVFAATRERPSMLLAHMCPGYLALAGPIARVRGVPALLWFTHPSVTATLRVADAVANGIVTTLPGSYPRPGPKVRATGHAIATDALAFSPRAEGSAGEGPLRLLSLGRTSPSKGHEQIIRGLARLRATGTDATLRIVGPATTGAERRHRDELRVTTDSLGLGDAVSIEEAAPPPMVPKVIRDADLLVNAMVDGAADKVVFEAMALGTPVITSNSAFAPVLADLPLDLSFAREDEGSLADRVRTVVGATEGDRSGTLRTLRERVEREHSIDHWARAVLDYAEELR